MKNLNGTLRRYDSASLDAEVEEELASIKADALIYPQIEALGLSVKEAKLNIAALMDFRDDFHYCHDCPGLAACKKANPHFSLVLERDGERLVRHYDPCVQMMSLSSFKNRYIRCSFPDEWRDASINGMEMSVSSRKSAVIAMSKIVKGDGKWLYFNGKAGSGRSYMLACFANNLTLKNGAGAFCDTNTILSELKDKSINDKPGFEELFSALANASVLVLDDFGNEFKSEYVYTSILFPLLLERDKKNLPTAFASDFTIASIANMYKTKIGAERADQLSELLRRRCVKEFDVTGVNLH